MRNSRTSISGAGSLSWRRTKQYERGDAADTYHRDVDAKPVSGTFLDGVDEAEHADERQPDAGQVPRPRRGVALLRQQDDAPNEQHDHHRDIDQKDRPPPEVLQQQPTDHGTQRGTRREHRGPDADSDAAITWLEKQPADQRQRRRCQCGPGHAKQRARADQELGRLAYAVTTDMAAKAVAPQSNNFL